ncbi:hypothetical protein EDF52_10273 [Curtobacterium sp. PhB42]|uniref:hypothetical protein n=1 Tax=unclassified Curtobacterium TaxID=257496 RepID=UPI00106286C0|nr:MULTISPECIES: hypothetical protein [unclassified Curtobacterium]TDW50985.1 hypothetical protein EDF52_10273 [Curtobacterium sp. PhB42]TDW56169.1 hypothetical protein EDF47_104280 [Curtobacterium sp. PhB190]
MDPSEQASRERRGRVGLTRSEGLRRKHFRSADDLTWPVPWNGQPWEQVLDGRFLPVARAPKSYSSEILGFLNGLAFRAMREHGVAPTEPTTLRDIRSSAPQIETISEIIWAAARKAGEAYLTDEMTPKRGTSRQRGLSWPTATGYVTYAWLEQACDAAAEWAWLHYEADYMSKRSAAGRKGGQISKRGPKYTWDLVEPYQHLTWTQQAMKTGLDRSTIARIHRRHRAETGVN